MKTLNKCILEVFCGVLLFLCNYHCSKWTGTVVDTLPGGGSGFDTSEHYGKCKQSTSLHVTHNCDTSHVSISCVWVHHCMLWGWCGGCCHGNCSKWPTGHYCSVTYILKVCRLKSETSHLKNLKVLLKPHTARLGLLNCTNHCHSSRDWRERYFRSASFVWIFHHVHISHKSQPSLICITSLHYLIWKYGCHFTVLYCQDDAGTIMFFVENISLSES